MFALGGQSHVLDRALARFCPERRKKSPIVRSAGDLDRFGMELDGETPFLSDGRKGGMVVPHVDDFLHAGDSRFRQESMNPIRAAFPFGTDESAARLGPGGQPAGLKFTGVYVASTKLGIHLSQCHYVEGLQLLPAGTLVGSGLDGFVDFRMAVGSRSLVMAASWQALRSRPDENYSTSRLRGACSNPHVPDVCELNKGRSQAQGDSRFGPALLYMGHGRHEPFAHEVAVGCRGGC